MRNEPGIRRVRILALAAASGFALLTGASGTAAAQGVRGYLQGQYQRYDQLVRVRDNDSTSHFEWRRREYFVQIADLNYQAMLRSDLMMQSTLRFSDLNYLNQPDGAQTPQGSVQLVHTYASAYAFHRPASVTTGFGPEGAAASNDSTSAATFTAKTQETAVMAQVFPPNLPRLDLTWTRRHRNRDEFSSEETGINRDARLSYLRGGLSVYGSVGDRRREATGTTSDLLQRVANAGGTLHLSPTARAGLDFNYDLADIRVPSRTGGAGDSRTQSAGFAGNWGPSAVSTFSANWQYRRSETGGPSGADLADQEGNASWTYVPRRPLRVSAGVGGRTVRDVGGSGQQRYANGVVALTGRVRPKWTGNASFTHTTNWDPFRGTYSVDGVRANTRGIFARGLEAEADGGVHANGDSAARATRVVSDLSARLLAVPLRSLYVAVRGRLYRAGRTLGEVTSTSRSTSLELRWKPSPSVELFGTHGVTGLLPNNKPRVTTNTLSARWSPSPRFQLSGDWSRSDQLRTESGAYGVSGREIASARLIALLSRRLTLNTGGGVAERGTLLENRQFDASLTWSFGR